LLALNVDSQFSKPRVRGKMPIFAKVLSGFVRNRGGQCTPPSGCSIRASRRSSSSSMAMTDASTD